MKEWNLELIYKKYEDFVKELNDFPNDIIEAEQLKGKLHSLEGMLAYERVMKKIDERIERLFCYASMKFDLNQKDSKASEDYQKVYQLFNELLSKTAFISPEILANDKNQVMQYLKNDKLKKYQFKMDQLFRSRDFYLDAKSEKLMANYGEATGGFNRLYDKLAVLIEKVLKLNFLLKRSYL